MPTGLPHLAGALAHERGGRLPFLGDVLGERVDLGVDRCR